MQSPPAETPSDGGSEKSRLDRELEEILARNENIRLLPPPPQTPRTPNARTTPLDHRSSIESMIPPRAWALLASPVFVALGLALAALLVSDISVLLATLLSLAAVVCVILPMVQRFRRTPAAPPDIRMWRGQVIDSSPPAPPSPLDAARNWWKSRQR